MSSHPPSRAVVTGGAGFVGRHLVEALAARGDAVVSVDMGAPPSGSPSVTYVSGDIRDAKAMCAAFAGAEVVFHNASLVHTKRNREEDVWSVNLGGTEAVIAACREAKVPRLVYVSSASAVYEGRDIRDGDESLPYSSISQAPYADSKIAAEKKVLAANGDGLATCAIRTHVIFGPGDTRFLPAILARARAGKLKLGVGSGDKLSDFTYISNLVDALLLAAEALAAGGKAAGQAYFITNGEPYPFFKFVGDVLAALGLPAIKGSVPYPIAYAVAAVAEAWDTLKGGTLHAEDGLTRFAVRYMCTHHYFSIAKARRELGYAPAVSLAEGIRRTTAHIASAGQGGGGGDP
jgi:sterol-4alpha-carboxylate 3-dehydrogenase (decarboxylating)